MEGNNLVYGDFRCIISFSNCNYRDILFMYNILCRKYKRFQATIVKSKNNDSYIVGHFMCMSILL